MVKKLLESFMKKNCKKLIKKSLELKKLLREKVIKHMLNGKSYDNLFDSWIVRHVYTKWVIFLNHMTVVKTK